MSYAQQKPGNLVAKVNSQNYIEIAVVNGSAANLLEAFVGGIVEVFL
jgi:S-adenosylmethionine hydrolase